VRRERGHCGEPDEAPSCKVQTRYIYRYIYEVFRNTPKELEFAQALRWRSPRTTKASRACPGPQAFLTERGFPQIERKSPAAMGTRKALSCIRRDLIDRPSPASQASRDPQADFEIAIFRAAAVFGGLARAFPASR
jgi:hypothetical protein